MSRCWRIRVCGRVQGVFYRASARDQARRLGLNGWVANLPGGEVELLVCGEDDVVVLLEAWLWEGPPMAQVTAVTRVPANDPEPAGFDVRYPD